MWTHCSTFYYSIYTTTYRYIGPPRRDTAAAAGRATRATPADPPAHPPGGTHTGGAGATSSAAKSTDCKQKVGPRARSSRPKIDLPSTRNRGSLSRHARPLPTPSTLPEAHPPHQTQAGARGPHLPSPCPSQAGLGRFRKVRAVEAPHTAHKRGVKACGETKKGAGLGLGGERLTGPIELKMPQVLEEDESEEFPARDMILSSGGACRARRRAHMGQV